MPLSSYTFIHKEAVLDNTKRQEILNYITELKDSL